MSVTSRLTGDTKRVHWVETPQISPIFVKAGSYEIEVGCNRSENSCDRSKGRVYMDSGPRIIVALRAKDRIELDCDAASGGIEIRRQK